MKRTKETTATIKNFTPLMDDIVIDLDLLAAAVWGRMWRYAQQYEQQCRASINTIAKELNIGRRTVIRKIQDLEKLGYLTDTTPDLRNRPHIYIVTDKVDVIVTIEGVSRCAREAQPEPVGVPEWHSGCARESLEDTIEETNNNITPQQAMVGILSAITGIDYKIKRNVGRLVKPAAELLEAGYTPEQIETGFGPGGWWYTQDWRGKQGQMPTLAQVVELAGQAVQKGRGKTVKKDGGMYL